MFTHRLYNRKLIFSTLISLAAAVLFIARPLFAQTTPSPVSPNTQGVSEANGNNNDFDDDVKQGKDELKKDPEAQKLQKEVVDGEDEQAGDGEDHDIHEDSNLQEAQNQEGVNEADQDNNNSEIDEVDDADNLDEQSQEVIDQHEQEKEEEIDQEVKQDSQSEGETQDQENSRAGVSTDTNQEAPQE